MVKTWGEGEDMEPYTLHHIPIPAGFLTEKLWIRFRARMSDIGDYLFVDDVRFLSPMPGPTPTPRPTPTPTPTRKPTPTPRPAPPAPPPKTYDVEANDDLQFVDKGLVIRAGDTVLWKNVGQRAHTIKFEDPGAPPEFVLGRQGSKTATYSRRFGEADVFEYVCRIHPPDMVGTITVR